MPNEDKEIKHNALKWLVCCQQTLTSTELVTAIAIRPGKAFDEEERLDEEELLLEILGSLIRFNRLTNKIDLAHFSVAEYLTKPRLTDGTENSHFIDREEGHVDLLESCLTYLIFLEQDTPSDASANQPEEAFLQYATFQWPFHAKRAQSKVKARELVYSFLKAPETTAYLQWSASQEKRFDPNLRVALPATHSGIYYAALFSLPRVVRQLLQDPASSKDARSIALLGAARDGDTEVVQMLLDNGATETARTVLGWTALHRAAYNSHFDVVRMLLNSRFQVNLTDSDGWTALHIAVSECYKDIVELLLEMGADVSMQLTESGWTPLHLAAQHGRVDIAQILLDAGAKVLQEENTGLHSLHIAATYEQYGVIWLLQDHCRKENQTPSRLARTKQDSQAPGTGTSQPSNARDEDILQALLSLVESFPEDIAFHEALGDFYFRRRLYSMASGSYQEYLYLNGLNTTETDVKDLLHKPYCCYDCAGGGMEFIQGYRFKCTLCRRFDLCMKCFDTASYSHLHDKSEFLRFPIENWVRTRPGC
jgi:hypothetical protein